jgi:hypothetical protein
MDGHLRGMDSFPSCLTHEEEPVAILFSQKMISSFILHMKILFLFSSTTFSQGNNASEEKERFCEKNIWMGMSSAYFLMKKEMNKALHSLRTLFILMRFAFTL